MGARASIFLSHVASCIKDGGLDSLSEISVPNLYSLSAYISLSLPIVDIYTFFAFNSPGKYVEHEFGITMFFGG